MDDSIAGPWKILGLVYHFHADESNIHLSLARKALDSLDREMYLLETFSNEKNIR